MKVRNAIDWHSAIADDFDAKYALKPQFIERNKVWEELIKKYSNRENSVLDIGCGSGVFSFVAGGLNKKVAGLDGSKEMIDLCKHKLTTSELKNITFSLSELSAMRNLVGSDNDLLICSSVLEYVDDLPTSVAMLKAMTNRGGIILLSMPNASSLYRKIESLIFKLIKRPKYYGFVNHVVTLIDMKNLMLAHGMEPLEHVYFSKTPLISGLFWKLGMEKYAGNLFILAAKCK
jgi:2-polyprenyl-3-methyl-5-hydroxy-6-metoxy-1,4-benzoquinol methylase